VRCWPVSPSIFVSRSSPVVGSGSSTRAGCTASVQATAVTVEPIIDNRTRVDNSATKRRGLSRRSARINPPITAHRISPSPRASIDAAHAFAGSAGGGVGETADSACVAAIAEALERYAANVGHLPTVAWGDQPAGATTFGFDELTLHATEQRASPLLADIGYGSTPRLIEMWNLHDDTSAFVPAVLAGLMTEYGTLSTSSGLAASFSLPHALLRAVEELIERDAFMTTWLHQLPGREVPVTPVAADLGRLGGWVRAFDLTQAWSPHPVAAVLGMVPLAGIPRFSMGLACRSTWADAVVKAEQECLQGTVFAGYEIRQHPDHASLEPDDVIDFDRHAVFYTARPERFDRLPIFRSSPASPPASAPPGTPAEQLRGLVTALHDAGVDLLARELTTIDLHQIGLRVVRVVAPQLTPIHHDHRAPFLGGTTSDRLWRYPDLEPVGPFPSPHPHPLG
jgi:ribosomal protein S12 methylthiotransferase accessory factor